MNLTYGSLFSGVGGFDMGFDAAGFRCAWQVEIDAAARSVLARHWPTVERFADVRDVGAACLSRVEVIIGGFPCQDVSVAGKRAGLAGARSGLFHEFVRVVSELRPAWLCLENVPGLLSSNGGRDFAVVLAALGGLGYGVAWRVCDAQHWGLAQRRQRVFLVGCPGGPVPAEILFEPESSGGHPAAGRTTGQDLAHAVRAGTADRGTDDADRLTYMVGAVSAKWAKGTGGPAGDEVQNLVASPVTASAGHHGHRSPRGDGSDNLVVAPFDPVNVTSKANRTRVEPGLPSPALHSRGMSVTAFHPTQDPISSTERSHAVSGEPTGSVAVAFTERTRKDGRNFEAQEELAYALTNPGSGGRPHSRHIAAGTVVRRLTPRECERLQGWPDDHARWTADGREQSDSTRYRQIGNGVATPVAAWIATRLRAVMERAA